MSLLLSTNTNTDCVELRRCSCPAPWKEEHATLSENREREGAGCELIAAFLTLLFLFYLNVCKSPEIHSFDYSYFCFLCLGYSHNHPSVLRDYSSGITPGDFGEPYVLQKTNLNWLCVRLGPACYAVSLAQFINTFVLLGFGATPSGTLLLLLTLHWGIDPCRLRDP